MINARTVEALKGDGHHFAAGAVAASLGLSPTYGCHVGMRSTYEASKAEFMRGYRAVRNPSLAQRSY